MKYLKQYVEQQNAWSRVFNRPLLDPENLTVAQVRELRDSIENALSPENLTCDGELRGTKLQAKAKMLHGAQAELERIYG